MTKFYTFRRRVPKLRPGWVIDFLRGRGFYLRRRRPVPRVGPQTRPPVVVTPPPSPFAGKGLITAWDAHAASGHPCDWVALQMDPEGDEGPIINNNPARIYYWQARPTHTIIAAANAKGIPYIGQAESQEQLEACLATTPTVPKALIGNPSSWTKAGFDEAARQGWHLILEWYWNAQPSYTAPNAMGYPHFVNVCFGCYDASSEQPDGRRVSLADYRAVWNGSFSVYLAETMTDADWQGFDAA